MRRGKNYRTAEAVSPAHPDKVADQISDAFVRKALEKDPNSRVAIETIMGHNLCVVIGEMKSAWDPHGDIQNIVYDTLLKCRYDIKDMGYPEVEERIEVQSPDIARGVDTGGAGDQGIMVGYACRDNIEKMPKELIYARNVLKHLWDTDERTRDAKAQVTLNEFGTLDTVLVSAERIPKDELADIVEKFFGKRGTSSGYRIITNPAGDWTGGFDADTGLTGRKIVQDAYGPRVQVGGGAFSGKDGTKVDRSAAYMARRKALELLKANGGAYEVTVEVAYGIGIAQPISAVAHVDSRLVTLDASCFEPRRIIEELDLANAPYAEISAWGHFGNPELPWERDIKSPSV